MLICAQLMMDLLPKLHVLFTQIARRDRDLEDQARRAASSVLLNLAEGNGSSRGNRRLRFETAYGSLKETQMALQIAVTFEYIGPLDAELVKRLDQVAASIWRLTHPR